MERVIQQITDQLLDQLPENREYFLITELRSWNFPTYIIKRIKVELERNLAESIKPPKTDWADMNTESVKQAWSHFLSAIRAEARLPASYAKTVIETAVADVIEMLVQPRDVIPEVVFGPDDTLGYEEVLERTDAIVVYRHFTKLIPRYMQKRNLDTLSREKCKEIVAKADEKLTARYSPLNWAQMLEPLFLLTDEQIDTNLLRLFFEDKDMPRVARKFDLMDTAVTRAEFIEVLSSPELLNMEGYEQQQSELFGGSVKETEKVEIEVSDEPSINTLFTEDDDEETVQEPAEEDSEPESEPVNENGNPEEVPVWQRYLSDEEKEVLEQVEEQEWEDKSGEEEFEEEPIIDLTEDKGPSVQEIAMLEELLEEGRSRFIEDIFGGSERAFDEAVEEIAGKDNWRNASKFIEKEVFKRNLVDMYSESAVDFTDRLQTYFLEKSKS